jgi:hypothetical protein
MLLLLLLLQGAAVAAVAAVAVATAALWPACWRLSLQSSLPESAQTLCCRQQLGLGLQGLQQQEHSSVALAAATCRLRQRPLGLCVLLPVEGCLLLRLPAAALLEAEAASALCCRGCRAAAVC